VPGSTHGTLALVDRTRRYAITMGSLAVEDVGRDRLARQLRAVGRTLADLGLMLD
jgi:hypothetical protein